eukprot:9472088-Pyramimonas_sp.AAC.1
MAQEASKKAPRRPEGPQCDPRGVQNGPRWPRDHEGFQTLQEGPRRSQNRLKIAPGASKRAPG